MAGVAKALNARSASLAAPLSSSSSSSHQQSQSSQRPVPPERAVLPSFAVVSEHCGRGNNWALGYYGGSAARRRGGDLDDQRRRQQQQQQLEEQQQQRQVLEQGDRQRGRRRLHGPDGGNDDTYGCDRYANDNHNYHSERKQQRHSSTSSSTSSSSSRFPTSRPGLLGADASGRAMHAKPFSTDYSENGQRLVGCHDEGDAASLSVRTMDAVRRQLEHSDVPTACITMHSVSGGTGSGLGSRISEDLRDMFGWKQALLHMAITPIVSGEIALQHYNSALTLSRLQEVSDAIWLCSNDDILAAAQLVSGSSPSTLGSLSSSSSSSLHNPAAFAQPFAQTNSYIASCLIDFLAPTLRSRSTAPASSFFGALGRGSNAQELDALLDSSSQWSDVGAQLARSLSHVCALPGTKMFEIWNSAGLAGMARSGIASSSSTTSSTSARGRGAMGGADDHSWRKHSEALTRLVPRTLRPLPTTETISSSVSSSSSSRATYDLVAQASNALWVDAIQDLRNNYFLTSPSAVTPGSAKSLRRDISYARPSIQSFSDPLSSSTASSVESAFHKTLSMQATFHGASPSENNPTARIVGLSLDGLAPTSSLASGGSLLSEKKGSAGSAALLEGCDNDADLTRMSGSVSRLFPTASWTSPAEAHSLTPSACSSYAAYCSMGPAVSAPRGGAFASAPSRSASVAVNRGYPVWGLHRMLLKGSDLLNSRAYTHWYERYGCTTEDIAEAIESLHCVVDNYRFMLSSSS